MKYITVKLTTEQYWGLLQVVDTKLNSLTNIIVERAEKGLNSPTHEKSLAFYKRLKTTLNTTYHDGNEVKK